eukprot:c18488_g1_i3 orf=215-1540(+)
MEGLAWCISISAMFASLWVLLYLWKNQGTGPNRKLPPGSMGLPVLGETLAYYLHFTRLSPDNILSEYRARYGNIFKTHLFGSPAIVSMDPEVNRFILNNEGKLFQCHWVKTSTHMLGKWSLHNIHGEMHKNVYGMLVNFTKSDRLKEHFLGDMDEYARFILSEWKNHEVLVNLEAKRYTIYLASKHLLGFPIGKDTDAVAEYYLQIFHGMVTLPIPLPGTQYTKGLKARQKMSELICRAIEDRKHHPEAHRVDFLSKLVSQTDRVYSTEQMTDFILHLLFAGHETSGSNLALAIKYLTDTPQALEQLRAEHDSIRRQKKPGERLSWEDYRNMTFSQDVVNESLRLTSIAAAIFRKAMEDVEIKGFTFPKGWRILVATRAAHMNESFFPDPFTFNPWRWKGKNYKAEKHFLPFGAGPRYCAGSELARLEIIVFLHYLVTSYT